MNTDNKKLRKLQLRELDILKEIIKIMDDTGIKYYLSAGTLLGAVRNQGFIPWDDDIDIMLTRDEFEKFKRIVHQYIPDYYQILYYNQKYEKGSRLYNQVVESVIDLKILDKRFQVKRNYYGVECNENIWIDIAVLDKVPDKYFSEILYKYRLKFLHSLLDMYRLELKDKNWESRTKIGDILLAINNKIHFARLIDPIKIIKKIDSFLMKNDKSNFNRYINYAGEYKFREIIPQNFLGKDTYLMFEGIPMRVPQNYDLYLTTIYGNNYMEPLPEEQQISKHIIEVD